MIRKPINDNVFLPLSVIKLRPEKLEEDTLSSDRDINVTLYVYQFYGSGASSVYDPYGNGERGFVAKELGKSYIGVAQSKVDYEQAKSIYDVELMMEVPDKCSVDFAFTELPNFYSTTHKATLNDVNDTLQFISNSLTPKGKFVCLVKDYKDGTVYVDVCSEIEQLCSSYGFYLIDKVVVDKTPRRVAEKTIRRAIKTKMSSLIHQTVLVFQQGPLSTDEPKTTYEPETLEKDSAEKFRNMLKRKIQDGLVKTKAKESVINTRREMGSMNLYGDNIVQTKFGTTITDPEGNVLELQNTGNELNNSAICWLKLVKGNESLSLIPDKSYSFGKFVSGWYWVPQERVIDFGDNWGILDKVIDYLKPLNIVVEGDSTNYLIELDSFIQNRHYNEYRPGGSALGFNRMCTVSKSAFRTSDETD